MEILISVSAKAAEYAVGPIKRGASYIFYPQAVIRETREKFEQLQVLRNKVDDRCQEAILDGEVIVEDVNKWLKDSQATLNEDGQWLQESLTVETDTSNTCIRNWLWARKQRKSAIRKKRKLLHLFRQGQNFPRVSRLPAANGTSLLTGDNYIVFNSVNLAFNKIKKALKENDESMIGVYGMGGIGKTSFVKKVITEAEEKQWFNSVVVSVVSKAPNINKIQAQLGEQLCLRYSYETELGRAAQLKNRMMREERILVVLDDVWKDIDLKTIGIPFGNDHKGCKILLTTRIETVCESMGCQKKIKLDLLSDEESWELFQIYAGTPPDLESVATKVTRECNRLPLALIVVASALRDKSQEDWKRALQKLQYSQLTDIDGIVYESIKLSYDFLKSEVTKRLFLMCSLFPEDSEIRPKELAGYALGYGLFDEDIAIDSYKKAKTHVKSRMFDLLSQNLLLKPDHRSDSFKMHDMVRDATLWITSKGEEVFLVPIPSNTRWTRDPKLMNAKVISLLACPENQYLSSPRESPQLEMLLLAQETPLPNVIDNCFEMMITLQVLDMTAIATDPLVLVLPSSLQHLSNLRTLYLRRWILKGNMSIIGRLRRLEMLSFAGSVLEKLPRELLDLSELIFFDLSACKAQTGFDPEVISQLVLKVEEFYPPKSRAMSELVYDED